MIQITPHMYWLMQKRLSRGKFRWWPKASSGQSLTHQRLAAHELQLLLWNGDPSSAAVAGMWRPLPLPVDSTDNVAAA